MSDRHGIFIHCSRVTGRHFQSVYACYRSDKDIANQERSKVFQKNEGLRSSRSSKGLKGREVSKEANFLNWSFVL